MCAQLPGPGPRGYAWLVAGQASTPSRQLGVFLACQGATRVRCALCITACCPGHASMQAADIRRKGGSCSSALPPGAMQQHATAVCAFHAVVAARQFIKDLSEQLWLIGLHSITLDPQQSRGSSATFTERWEDFQAGAAPPPAPYLPRHTAYGCSAAAAPTGNDNLSGRGIGSSAAQSPKCAAPVAAGSSGGAADGSSNQLLNRQFFPLLSVDVSELPRCRPQSADAAGTWVGAPCLRQPSLGRLEWEQCDDDLRTFMPVELAAVL